MPTYATPAEYADWLPGGVATERELRLASLVVDAALTGAVYVTDSEGLPTDPVQRVAVQEATCAVVEASKPAAGAGPQLPGLKAATIGGVRYELEAAAQAAPGARPPLPFVARQLLLNARLGPGLVIVDG